MGPSQPQLRHLLMQALWVCCFAVLFSFPAMARDLEAKVQEIPEGWRFMPRVSFSLEYGGYAIHQDHYASLLRRQVDIDLIQYRRHILYLNFDENTFFGTPADKWDFNLMKYRLALMGYRYDFGNYYAGIFFKHECNNPIHTEKYRNLIDRERANLYYFGLEFLTKSMRPGMKDRGINFDSPNRFEFLGRFHGGASVSKVFYRENSNPDWFFNAVVRYDLLRYGRMVPYAEAAVEALTGPALRASPSVEMGLRFNLWRVDLTPFAKWSRNQEFLSERIAPTVPFLAAKNALYVGARLEGLIDREALTAAPDYCCFQLFPEVHGHADYALHLRQRFFKGHGDLEIDLEVLRLGSWTAFFYAGMFFDSHFKNYKPDKVTYHLQYGLTYAWKRFFGEAFVDHSKRIDSLGFTNVMERANLAGLRLGTRGMKPGQVNYGISFDTPESFQWLNHLNGQVSLGHFFQNRDWQFLWNLNAKARWDILRFHRLIPYVQGEINWLAGGGRTPDAVEYGVEPGLRLHGVLDFCLYLRLQHRENVRFLNGPSDDQALIGVKALF